MKATSKKILKIIIAITILIVFVLLIILLTGKKKVEQKAENLPTIVVQKPVQQDLIESINISGYVEADSMIPVVPFVAGTIMEYPVKAGDFVEKDTLIARIDDAPYRQQMLQAKAAYQAAAGTFDRVKNLYKAGATTQQNYDNARAQYDATTAQYNLAKLQVGYTLVKAPVSGTVLIADQSVGGIGTTTAPIAVLADLSTQVVRLKVPEKYFDLFTMDREKLEVKVTRPSSGDMFEDAVTSATIKNIAPYVSPESKNFEVICLLNEPGQRFRPGMYVKVQVAYKTHKNVYTLPMQVKKLDGSYYTYDSENQTVHFIKPEKTPDDGLNFIVPSEFKDTFFVIDGQNFIFDGQRVRLYSDALKEHGIED